jgi:heterodisulfide reductase subunit B
MSRKIEDLLDYKYEGTIKILHVLELFDQFVGVEKIAEKVVRPLTNLKLVCYYGCLLVRPHDIMNFDDPENPMIIDRLVSATGAQALDWSCKTECCGGSLSLTRDDIVCDLVAQLIGMAKDAGADGIVVACPLCGQNLEMRQRENFPIFYFTELLGFAFNMEECENWFDRHLVDVHGLLRSLNLLQ